MRLVRLGGDPEPRRDLYAGEAPVSRDRDSPWRGPHRVSTQPPCRAVQRSSAPHSRPLQRLILPFIPRQIHETLGHHLRGTRLQGATLTPRYGVPYAKATPPTRCTGSSVSVETAACWLAPRHQPAPDPACSPRRAVRGGIRGPYPWACLALSP